MATIEDSIADLTTATTALTTAVGVQQTAVSNAVIGFNDVTSRVNTGLNLVDNTTDLNKPISTVVQTGLNLKQNTLVSGTNISTVNGISLLSGNPLVIERSATSINRVTYDNRGTLRSTTSQIDDSTLVESLGVFMWINSKLEPDDDETCFTTSSGQWLLQTPAWDLIDAWNLYEQSFTDDWREDEETRFAAYLLKSE